MTTSSTSTDTLPAVLSKRWFILRHGRSEANEAGIIASRLANAEHAYGLIEQGRAEVAASVELAAQQLLSRPPLVLITSPFLRTRETAEIAGSLLDVVPTVDNRLRERDFGEFELLSDRHYKEVWATDPEKPATPPGRAETVEAVAGRALDLILEVERESPAHTCLLVTHCDVAMILECLFSDLDPCHHRRLDPITTGGLRRLQRGRRKLGQ